MKYDILVVKWHYSASRKQKGLSDMYRRGPFVEDQEKLVALASKACYLVSLCFTLFLLCIEFLVTVFI